MLRDLKREVMVKQRRTIMADETGKIYYNGSETKGYTNPNVTKAKKALIDLIEYTLANPTPRFSDAPVISDGPKIFTHSMFEALSIARSTIDKALAELIREGKITRISRGKYVYNLADTVPTESPKIPKQKKLLLSDLRFKRKSGVLSHITGAISRKQLKAIEFLRFNIECGVVIDWEDHTSSLMHIDELEVILPSPPNID